MGKLQSLGAVHGHEANRVFTFVCFQGNHAASLAKKSEIVDQFFQFDRLVDLLLLPVLDEVEGGLKNGRGAIERKLLDDDVERGAGLRLRAADFFARALHGGENVGAAVDPVERGGERNDLAFAIVPGDGPHDLAKLLWIHVKAAAERPRETG